MSATYNFSIQNDTLKGEVDAGALTEEIQSSSIIIALDSVTTSNDVLSVKFKTTLSPSDQNILNDIVSLHNGDPVEFVNTVKLQQQNPETLAIQSTPRYSKPGMLQRIHEIEWTTSREGGLIHDKNYHDLNTGWSSCQFYEKIDGVETLMENPSQSQLNSRCIRTDFHWEPDVDYMVLSGQLRQMETPTENVYFWGLFANVKFDGSAYGLPIEVLGGGMNLAFNEPLVPFGMKGVSASTLYVDGLDDGNGGKIFVGPDLGCNRISFIFRHPVGFKHRINAVFEIFR